MFDQQEFVNGLDQLGLEYTAEQINRIDRYVQELLLWNKKLNLIGANNRDLVSRHLLDSLAPAETLRKLKPKSIADVGSGAGLPGIPLAIFHPEWEFSLVERSRKRCGFLRNASVLLGLKDQVTVVEKTLEEVTAKFDLVVFRAFREFGDFLPLLLNILKPGGSLAAYKGRSEQVNAEIAELKNSRDSDRIQSVEVYPLSVPGLAEERHLMVVTTKDTDS